MSGVGNFFSNLLDPFHVFTKSRQEKSQEEYNDRQFNLQQQQFDYQKWFDANNIQLKTKDAMQAGINPLVATSGATSSVTASSQPQMPNADNSAGYGMLSDMIGKIISHSEYNDQLDLERDKLNLAKKTQSDQDSNYQQYLAYLRARAGADVTRTQIYKDLASIQGEESKMRQKSMAHDLLIRIQDNYGSQSSIYKKILGELQSFLGDTFGPPPSEPPKLSDGAVPPKKSKTPSVSPKEHSDAFKAYKHALDSGYQGTFDEWYNISRYGRR